MKRLRPLFALAFVGVVLFACGSIREDEFDCENAAAHLESCCPGFQASRLSCTYTSIGCNATVYPELTVEQSTCIRDESCGALRANGVCTRAAALQTSGVTVIDSDASAPSAGFPTVCP